MSPDEYATIVTDWVAIYAKDEVETCFESFGVKNIPKKVKKVIKLLKQIFTEYIYTLQ